MQKVISALQQSQNALLESPTGTGKTLSLLCASLAWLKAERMNQLLCTNTKEFAKIVYTSRTHSQLAQVQKELKNTAFKPRTVLVASRDHLCVNSTVNQSRGTQLNAACSQAKKGVNPCVFFKNRDEGRKNMSWDPMDIEELHKQALEHLWCPYYATKDRAHAADIIFMPYNYLIDEDIRESYSIQFENSLIIFDEAHNVPQAQEEVTSFELRAKALSVTQAELVSLQESRSQNDQKEWKATEDEVRLLRDITHNFTKHITSYRLDIHPDQIQVNEAKYLPPRALVLPGASVFEIFDQGCSFQSEGKKLSIKSNWELVKAAFDHCLADVADIQKDKQKTNIEAWFGVLKKVVKLDEIADEFYVFLYDEEDPKSKNKKSTQRVFGFWCFNAGVGFKQIQALKPRSIVLTSGTLSPLQSFESELQLEFKSKLENPHVIQTEQVNISILKRGLNNTEFKFDFRSRDNPEMLDDLASTIAAAAKLVSGGILLFFPSYKLLNDCYERWHKKGGLDEIEAVKKVFREPHNAGDYQAVIDRFYSEIYEGEKKGAVMMGVCRGRISEGLDFSDEAARMVVVIGIPFPQMYDAKVILKRNYLDAKGCQLSGRDWYNQQATRAVNQAIGRVIRHAQDYGAIVLVDCRYAYQSNRSQISKWLRDSTKEYSQYDSFQSQLSSFYSDMRARGFQPKVKQLEQVRIDFDHEMPQKVNSKAHFDTGPTNNKRQITITKMAKKNNLKRSLQEYQATKPVKPTEPEDATTQAAKVVAAMRSQNQDLEKFKFQKPNLQSSIKKLSEPVPTQQKMTNSQDLISLLKQELNEDDLRLIYRALTMIKQAPAQSDTAAAEFSQLVQDIFLEDFSPNRIELLMKLVEYVPACHKLSVKQHLKESMINFNK